MLSDLSLASIRKMTAELKKPVRLIVFTTDIGCESCPDMLKLGHAIKKHFNKIALETYDMVMDRDKVQLYGVKLAPTIIIQGGDGQWAAFVGYLEDSVLEVLLSGIKALSDGTAWFPEDIIRALNHLTHDVKIRVFAESDCTQCKPVAETAIGLAFTSKFISADIILASEYPDLIKKFNIKTFPTTIFGDNMQMIGHVTEGQFLEMIFQTEGIKAGPDKRCLICGNHSPDVICSSCKTRVEAEAKDHKLKSEKMNR
jgi:thiol-disulfide isomerase/thioredoxin